MWEVKLKIFDLNSCSKPFITDSTVINIATPSIIPIIDILDITEINPVFFCDLNNLCAIKIEQKVANDFAVLSLNEF